MTTNETEPLVNSQIDLESGQSSEPQEASPADEDEDELGPSSCFIFFRVHSLVCVLSLALMAIAQALPSPHRKMEFISILQQFYILLACAFGAITELELSEWFISKVAPVFVDWMARGAVYLFMAVVATEQSTIDSDDAKIHQDNVGGKIVTAVLLNIAATGLLISGGLYIIMGLFCLKGIKERSERENDERLRRSVEAQRYVDSE